MRKQLEEDCPGDFKRVISFNMLPSDVSLFSCETQSAVDQRNHDQRKEKRNNGNSQYP